MSLKPLNKLEGDIYIYILLIFHLPTWKQVKRENKVKSVLLLLLSFLSQLLSARLKLLERNGKHYFGTIPHHIDAAYCFCRFKENIDPFVGSNSLRIFPHLQITDQTFISSTMQRQGTQNGVTRVLSSGHTVLWVMT